MACQRCSSIKIVNVSGKCSDMFSAGNAIIDYEGYVPHDLGIGGGDYIRFSYCLDCGQMQGAFPVDSMSFPHFKIADVYPEGLCPDCNTPIPDDAYSEDSCANCGHVFTILEE